MSDNTGVLFSSRRYSSGALCFQPVCPVVPLSVLMSDNIILLGINVTSRLSPKWTTVENCV